MSDIDLLQTIELLKAHQGGLRKLRDQLYKVPDAKLTGAVMAARSELCEALVPLQDCISILEQPEGDPW